MKKKLMSLMLMFGLSLSAVSGCGKESESVVDSLNVEGKDIVLKVGNKTYSADELFGDMLSTTTGAEEIYNKVLRTVVESTIGVDPDMQASWDLLLDSFEEEVETYAASNGVSEEDARSKLLADEGYSSIDEKKDEYFYTVRLSKMQDKYWDERIDYYAEKYFNDRLPYYVKHVLVEAQYSSARTAYASTITSDDASDLYDVYDMLVKGKKFSYIMNEKSEDTGSNNTGKGYYVDMTTGFVTEFLHGLYTFDSMLKGKTDKVYGLTSEVTEFYTSSVAGESEYGFGVINASDIVALGNTATDTTDNDITICKDGMETCEKTSTIYTAYGSTSSPLYSRSMIFNQTFNNTAINVIAYDLEGDIPANTKKININGEEKYVLTDENGNIVFVVRATGVRNNTTYTWIHFITVNVSPFDENARLFFSMDQEATIKKMVSEKKKSLELAGKTGTELETELEEYKESLEDYKTYVDIIGGTESATSRNSAIEELEGYIRSYANKGSADESEKYLTYDMVDYYMGDKIVLNDAVKGIINAYINEQRNLVDLTNNNSIVEGWNDYYDLIELYNSDYIEKKRIPLECSYAANGNSDKLCKYTYEEGYFIKLTLDVNSGNTLDSAWDNYYYQIGDDVILPTPTKSEYQFLGWYTTAEDTETVVGVKVGDGGDKLDTKVTSTTHKTKLYARWAANEGGAA